MARHVWSVRGGFLLLETIVTVMILTGGLTMVARSLSSSLEALKASRDYTKALLLLEQKTGELEAGGWAGTASGRFSPEDGTFQWEVKTSTPREFDLSETQVTVSWEQGGRPRAISLVTYLPRERP